MPAKLHVGDHVRYTTKWLRSTGCYAGAIPHARGRITAFKSLMGVDYGFTDLHLHTLPWVTDHGAQVCQRALVIVAWENDHFDEVPKRILNANLEIAP